MKKNKNIQKKSHKMDLAIFSTIRFKNIQIEQEILEKYLQEISVRLLMLKLVNADKDNVLFVDTLRLMAVIQQLWNKMEDLKNSKE